MKDISVIYGYLAPYAAPVPSAYVLGVNVYHSIKLVSGDEYAWVAALAALVGMIGIEATGGLSAILVSRAFVQKSFSIMRLAILAVVAYAGFVAWGIYSSNESRPMITTVAITLLAYFVVALFEGMKEVDKQKHDTVSLALQSAQARALELEAEKELLEAERRKTNSEIRLAKVSNLSSGQAVLSNGQMDTSTGQKKALDPSILDAARVFFGSNPRASARSWLETAGCPVKSPMTASKYKAAVEAEKASQEV